MVDRGNHISRQHFRIMDVFHAAVNELTHTPTTMSREELGGEKTKC